MKKPLNPTVHGVIDYGAGIFLLLAPTIFGFAGLPANILLATGAIHLMMSLMTAYPLGMIKAIPFTIHSKIEFMAGLFVAASPWIFDFSNLTLIRNVYLGFSAVLGVVWMLTDYRNDSGAGSAEIFTEYRNDRRNAA